MVQGGEEKGGEAGSRGGSLKKGGAGTPLRTMDTVKRLAT